MLSICLAFAALQKAPAVAVRDKYIPEEIRSRVLPEHIICVQRSESNIYFVGVEKEEKGPFFRVSFRADSSVFKGIKTRKINEHDSILYFRNYRCLRRLGILTSGRSKSHLGERPGDKLVWTPGSVDIDTALIDMLRKLPEEVRLKTKTYSLDVPGWVATGSKN